MRAAGLFLWAYAVHSYISQQLFCLTSLSAWRFITGEQAFKKDDGMATATARTKNNAPTTEQELPLARINQLYPDCWVLVEETAWDKRGNPLRGIVRAANPKREALRAAVHKCHEREGVKTFVFYTGELIPKGIIVVL